MSEIEYDETLPFAVVGAITGRLYARFDGFSPAQAFVNVAIVPRVYRIVDTSPPPPRLVLPKDAYYITWSLPGDVFGGNYYAMRINSEQWEVDGEYRKSEEELVEQIVQDSDGQVQVLTAGEIVEVKK